MIEDAIIAYDDDAGIVFQFRDGCWYSMGDYDILSPEQRALAEAHPLFEGWEEDSDDETIFYGLLVPEGTEEDSDSDDETSDGENTQQV